VIIFDILINFEKETNKFITEKILDNALANSKSYVFKEMKELLKKMLNEKDRE